MPDEHICPTCGGSGEGVTYDSGGAASGWDCPDCGGSGKAENSITANEAQPLHLTLEEAMAAVGHPGWYLQRRTYDDAPDEWLVVDRFGGIRGTGGSWPEAVSAALGRPVVARDEAAELVEVLAALLNYTKACEGLLNAVPAEQVRRAEAALARYKSDKEAQ